MTVTERGKTKGWALQKVSQGGPHRKRDLGTGGSQSLGICHSDKPPRPWWLRFQHCLARESALWAESGGEGLPLPLGRRVDLEDALVTWPPAGRGLGTVFVAWASLQYGGWLPKVGFPKE